MGLAEGTAFDGAFPAITAASVVRVAFYGSTEKRGRCFADVEDDAGVREAVEGGEIHEEDVAGEWAAQQYLVLCGEVA
jgi:hypothetical protein